MAAKLSIGGRSTGFRRASTSFVYTRVRRGETQMQLCALCSLASVSVVPMRLSGHARAEQCQRVEEPVAGVGAGAWAVAVRTTRGCETTRRRWRPHSMSDSLHG